MVLQLSLPFHAAVSANLVASTAKACWIPCPLKVSKWSKMEPPLYRFMASRRSKKIEVCNSVVEVLEMCWKCSTISFVKAKSPSPTIITCRCATYLSQNTALAAKIAVPDFHGARVATCALALHRSFVLGWVEGQWLWNAMECHGWSNAHFTHLNFMGIKWWPVNLSMFLDGRSVFSIDLELYLRVLYALASSDVIIYWKKNNRFYHQTECIFHHTSVLRLPGYLTLLLWFSAKPMFPCIFHHLQHLLGNILGEGLRHQQVPSEDNL